MIYFTFKPLTKSQFSLIFKWLSFPHISEWWYESKNYETFYAKYEKKLQDSALGLFLIYHNTKPIGFISWYNTAQHPINSVSFPNPTFGIDLFIADLDYIGKGYGQKIIKQFIDEILAPLKPKKIIADPEVKNARSIYVFEKVGFKKMKIIESIDGTRVISTQLMEMDICKT